LEGLFLLAKRQILDERDGSLRKLSREVVVFDKRLHQLLDDMAETLTDAEGAGLAAVQVGVLRRVFITDLGEGITEYINPKIVELSEDMLNESEGCLSFPGQYGMVERPRFVKLEAQDRYGNLVVHEGEGLLARAMCHEYDHLNGVLFCDLATEMLDEEEAQQEANRRAKK
jgi:peptide deformylase